MLSYTTVDCFTDKAWSGNPAAVFVLAPDEAVFDDLAHLQTLAIELCIPATAFVRPLPDSTVEEPHYQIRYFSPAREIPLCGHATMGSSHVLLGSVHPKVKQIKFETTLHGHLFARRALDGRITLGFPSDEGILDTVDPDSERYQAAVKGIEEAARVAASQVVDVAYSSRGCLIEVSRDVDVATLAVQSKKFAHLAGFVVVSQLAPLGSPHDIYSRVFTAAIGADEDPVCGSAHCFTAPRWLGTAARARLEKASFRDAATNVLRCRQVSQRGGEMDVCWEPNTGRVTLTGSAVSISKGEFLL